MPKASSRDTAGGAWRAGDADRPGRRGRIQHGLGRKRVGPGLSLRCSATTRRWSVAARKSSMRAGARSDNPILLDPRRRRRRSVQRPAGAGARRGHGWRFELRACPTRDPGMSPWRSGATKPRSATCLAIAAEQLERSRPSAPGALPFAVVGNRQPRSSTSGDRSRFRRSAGRPAAFGAVRQAAEDDPELSTGRVRAEPFDASAIDLTEAIGAGAQISSGCQQTVSHHDRRSQHHWAGGSGAAGGSLAGTRCRSWR